MAKIIKVTAAVDPSIVRQILSGKRDIPPVLSISLTDRNKTQANSKLGSLFSKFTGFITKAVNSFSLLNIINARFVSVSRNTASDTPYDHFAVKIPSTDGVSLHGLFFPHENSDKVVLYLKGGEGTIGLWYKAALGLQENVPANFLIADYRGYGKSPGSPTVKGLIDDTFAMYKYLVYERGFKPENISLYGRSLGGSLALELASKVKVRSVIVQSSFSSLGDLFRRAIPFMPQFFSDFIAGDSLNSKSLIQKVKVPILIGHGSKDPIVPKAQALKLYNHANEPKKLIILEGADHSHLRKYFTEEYYAVLRQLIV